MGKLSSVYNVMIDPFSFLTIASKETGRNIIYITGGNINIFNNLKTGVNICILCIYFYSLKHIFPCTFLAFSY